MEVVFLLVAAAIFAACVYFRTERSGGNTPDLPSGRRDDIRQNDK